MALVSQYSYILILAIGMVLAIICGHIDLSGGSIAAFTGIEVCSSHRWFEASRAERNGRQICGTWDIPESAPYSGIAVTPAAGPL